MTKEALSRFVEAMPDGAALEIHLGGVYDSWQPWNADMKLQIRAVIYPPREDGAKEKEVRDGHAEND